MKKELINDSRLTPTMKRTRNGKKQMFREPGIDQQFTSEENAAAVLVHPTDVSMYAKLIEEKWYWISGCAECKGEPRDWMSYQECEEHNRCRRCEKKRKELPKDTKVWGGEKGWICFPCEDERKAEIKNEVFKNLDVDDIDSSYCDDIICPHCATKLSSDDIYETQDMSCYVCDGELEVEVYHTRTFTTIVKGKRITK